MRKVLVVSMVLVLSFLMLNCGGSNELVKNTSGMPDFMLNPPKAEGKLFGSGQAKKQSMQLAKEAADARALKDVARSLSSKVASKFKDYLSEAGIGDAAEVSQVTTSITEILTKVQLVGCVIVKRELIDGTMFSLAVLDLNENFVSQIKGIIQSSIEANDVLRQKFEAKKGFDELDAMVGRIKQ